MKYAHVIRHVPFEDLGNLEPALRQARFDIVFSEAGLDDVSALDPLSPDLVIVLGGPIGVYEHDAYPFIGDELRLLKRRLAADRPTLGICLGAQLIAAALGARVYPGENGKELGWSRLLPGEQAETHRYLDELYGEGVEVLHWHGDTFDLPEGAVHLAASEAYRNQAFSWGKATLALQFHAEVTPPGLERWYIGHACEISQTQLDVAALRAEGRRKAALLDEPAKNVWLSWLADRM